MVALVMALILILVISWTLGAAIWRLAGHARYAAVEAPLGFAALLTVGGLSSWLPGGTAAGIGVIGALAVLSLVYLGRTGGWSDTPLWPAALVVVVALLAMIPFAVSGRSGLLGVGTNDDMSQHLLAAWTLQGHAPSASSKLLTSGYPIGPHAIVATLSAATGISLEHMFTALIISVPVLLALVAAALMPGKSATLRAGAGALVGLCYLQAAYLVQASFKEPIEAVLLVTFTVTVTAGAEGRSLLRYVPLALVGAATVFANSYIGVVWPAGMLLLWIVAGLVKPGRAGAVKASVRTLARPVAVAMLLFLVLVAPEASRIARFAGSGYNHEGPKVLGDLLRPLPPLEALGIWPRLDFRFDLPLATLGGVLALVALAGLVAGLVRSLGRREFAVPCALLAAVALVGLTSTRSPYTAAKALVIAAPLVTLLLAREALVLRGSMVRARSWQAIPVLLVALVLAVGAYSDLEVLRDGPVGPSSHAEQLAGLRPIIGRQPTLFLGADDYIHWELRGAVVATPPQPLYAGAVVPLRRDKAQPARSNYTSARSATSSSRFAGLGLAFDFDSVPVGWLNRFIYVIRPHSGYTGPPPENWRLVRGTRSYELWRRTGPTRPYRTLTAIDNPGAILDCTTPAGRAIARGGGAAMTQPTPVIGERTSWHGQVGYAGTSAHQSLHLGAGTWRISLQYDGSAPLTVRGSGMRAVLPANLESLGPYWYVGRVHLRRRAWIRLTVSSAPLSTAGRVLGAFGLTRAPAPTGLRPLGRITATRPAAADRLISLTRACGRYVDWYRSAGTGT